MTTPQSPLEIEMVLHAHVLGCYKPPTSPAHQGALHRLLAADMVMRNLEGHVTTTLRGQFWVKHLLTVHYPVQVFSIPLEEK